MPQASTKVKLWDLPIRLFHWAIVVLVGLLWWSAENHKIDIHVTAGLTLAALIVFRLIWGLIGSSTARFSNFVKGPGAVIGYLKSLRSGESQPVVGHNPVGGWSVIALIGLLALQVGIGLIAQDVDGVASGPLNHFVSYETGDAAREVHELVFNLILLFVALHVAAIVFYTVVKKDRLVPPMITGRKALPEGVAAPRMAPLWRAIPALLIAVAFAWWLSKGAPTSWEQLTAPPPPPVENYM